MAVQAVLIEGLAHENPLIQQEAARLVAETLPGEVGREKRGESNIDISADGGKHQWSCYIFHLYALAILYSYFSFYVLHHHIT